MIRPLAEAFRTVINARFPQWDGETILIYILSVIWAVLVCVYMKMKKGKVFGVALLFSYIYSVLVTTLFMRTVYPTYRYTLEINFIRQILVEHNKIILAESALNFLLIMPVGFFMPLLINKRPYLKTALFGLTMTLFIETTQLVTRLGEFQTDDVILNFGGCLFGVSAIWLLDKAFAAIYRTRKKRTEERKNG